VFCQQGQYEKAIVERAGCDLGTPRRRPESLDFGTFRSDIQLRNSRIPFQYPQIWHEKKFGKRNQGRIADDFQYFADLYLRLVASVQALAQCWLDEAAFAQALWRLRACSADGGQRVSAPPPTRLQ
jgi:hypothetical protein